MQKQTNLRILVAAPEYPYPVVGGLQKQAHELNQQLLQLGCELLVLSGKHDATGQSEEVVDGVSVRRAPFIRKHRWHLVSNALWSAWQVFFRAGRYDVVHIHNLSTFGALVAVAARLRRTPVLMKLPNVGQMGIPGLRKYVLGDGILLMLKCVSAFVAMSEKSVDELNEIDTPARKIFKMVNGINLKKFDASIAAKAPISVGSSPVDVIFTGRLVKTKGVEDLLNAWKHLKEEGLIDQFAGRLRIVGVGPDQSRLEQIMVNLGLEESVIFEGYRTDIPQLLAQSSVFLLPSYSEGNSNSILEAMAAGLPVISTDVGGTRLLMGKEASEFVVDPGDITGLENCIRKLISSSDRRTSMGEQMRTRVEQLFDIRVVAEEYHAAYGELTRGAQADLANFASAAFDQDQCNRQVKATSLAS